MTLNPHNDTMVSTKYFLGVISMKKMTKIIAGVAAVATLACGTAAMAGCGDKGQTYTGEYHYNKYGHEYGIKVNVTLKGEKIAKVAVAESEYVSLSDANPDYGWTEAKRQVWTDGLNGLLNAYKGKTVADILAVTVGLDGQEPTTVSESSVKLTGCTQGSGRLVLAVQNALENAGYAMGEYHYNKYGHEYGIKVAVKVNGEKISKVTVLNSEYVSLSDANPDYGWTEAKRQVWTDGLDNLLKAYSGKTVASVKAVTVGKDGDEPTTVSESTLKLTGCTQGSGRLVLAVQDALAKLAK